MVYLLHFDRPFKHARHYLGYADDVDKRLAVHRRPHTSKHHRLIQVIHDAGIGFTLARTWEGGRDVERSLKRRKCGPRLCPICRREASTHARV